jgi:hypothetical protein
MLLTNRKKLAPFALCVLICVFLTASALAQTAKQAKSARTQVANQLKEFRSTAYAMLQEADTLNFSVTPSKEIHWESHAQRLRTLTDHVNRLGKILAKLEAQKSAATENQAMAIEHARPDLVSIARNLTEAIVLANENRFNVHRPEYAEAVSNIYAHTDALYNQVDTILDYEQAEMRLDNLELKPSPMETKLTTNAHD